jgi:Fe-S-cluster containining protein
MQGGPDFTEAEMKKVVKAGHKNYFFAVRNGFYELTSKKGRCAYLKKDNSCEIQNFKPKMCRAWPVFPKRKNTYLLIDCPVTKLLSKAQIEKCKKEASGITKKMLDVSLDFSTLSKSDGKLIKRRYDKFKKRVLK